MKFKFLYGLALVAVCASASPASARWTTASHLLDGACSIGSKNAEGIIASVILDADGSSSLVFNIPLQRGNWFVINVGHEWSQAFQNYSSNNVSVKLEPGFEDAFRRSSSLALFSHNSGFVGSPFSLQGSNAAYDQLRQCHQNFSSEHRASPLEQALSELESNASSKSGGSSGGDSSDWSPRERALMAEWADLNSKCRGGTDPAKVAKACDRRDGVMASQLDAANICYGRKGEYGYQHELHRCGPDSYRLKP